MGDRISIQFKNGRELSVVLFSHWRGKSLLVSVENYMKELKEDLNGRVTPLDRLEPNTVMVDFIRYLTFDMKRVDSDLYLGGSVKSGDNSDNGHYIYNLAVNSRFKEWN